MEALADEILLVIFEKLDHAVCLIRCGAVCRLWHRVHKEVTRLSVATREEWRIVRSFPKLVRLDLRYPRVIGTEVMKDVAPRLEYLIMHTSGMENPGDVTGFDIFPSNTCFSKLETLVIWSRSPMQYWASHSTATFPCLKACILSGVANPGWLEGLLKGSPELLQLEVRCNGWGRKDLMASGTIGTTRGDKLVIKSANLQTLDLLGIRWEHVEVDCPQLVFLKLESVKRLVLGPSATRLQIVELYSPGCSLELKPGVKSKYFFIEEPQLASSGKWSGEELLRCCEIENLDAVENVNVLIPTVVDFWTPNEPELKGVRCISFFDISKISQGKDNGVPVSDPFFGRLDMCRVGQDLDSLDLGCLVLGVMCSGKFDMSTWMQLRSLLFNQLGTLRTVVVFSEAELSRTIQRKLAIEGVVFRFVTGTFETENVKVILSREMHAVHCSGRELALLEGCC